MTSTQPSTHSRLSSATEAAVTASAPRETFASRLGTLMTIIGVAIGLGNVWRFPYMVGKFGGAAFVLFYVLVSVVIGVPALMAEFALGRSARRGPVGAFGRGGLPYGRYVGWFLFFVVTAATGYYSAVIGWVLWYTVSQVAALAHLRVDAAAILPPGDGFVLRRGPLDARDPVHRWLLPALLRLVGLRGAPSHHRVAWHQRNRLG